MNCDEAEPLLGAHLDEELDAVHDAAVAAHLEHCPACANRLLALSEQRRLLGEKLTRHVAPPDLLAAVHAGLPHRPPAAPRPVRPWLQPVLLAAAVALGLWAGDFWGRRQAARDALGNEVVAGFVRSRQGGHAIDVQSSDRHTVKPWFNGRVDVAPVVPDLAAEGFPLLGGRIERVGGHNAAVIVYGHALHNIDLYVWTGDPAPDALPAAKSGFALRAWTMGDLNFAAVSDVPGDTLAKFAEAYRTAAH